MNHHEKSLETRKMTRLQWLSAPFLTSEEGQEKAMPLSASCIRFLSALSRGQLHTAVWNHVLLLLWQKASVTFPVLHLLFHISFKHAFRVERGLLSTTSSFSSSRNTLCSSFSNAFTLLYIYITCCFWVSQLQMVKSDILYVSLCISHTLSDTLSHRLTN